MARPAPTHELNDDEANSLDNHPLVVQDLGPPVTLERTVPQSRSGSTGLSLTGLLTMLVISSSRPRQCRSRAWLSCDRSVILSVDLTAALTDSPPALKSIE